MSSNFRIYRENPFQRAIQAFGRIKPCPESYTDKVAMVIAICQMVLTGFLAVAMFIAFIIFMRSDVRHLDTLEGKDIIRDMNHPELVITRVVMVIAFVGLFLCVFLHYFLYKGVKQRNFKIVNRWWYIFAVSTFIFLCLGCIVRTERVKAKAPLPYGCVESLDMAFDLYSLWVIYVFKKSLKEPTDPTVEFERVI